MTRRPPRRALLLSISILSALATIIVAMNLMGFASAAPRIPWRWSASLEHTSGTLLEAWRYADLQAQVEQAAAWAHEKPAAERPAYDPYKGWNTWCESRPTPCKAQADCTPDRNGQPRKCMLPWWSKTEKVCAINYRNRADLKRLKMETQHTVEAQCTGRCNATELGKFVTLVAMRESTMRPWKRHLLDDDVEYAKSIWKQHYKQYAEINPHYKDGRERWEQGLGLLGEQAVTFVPHWDLRAPPEVLCRRPIAIATYLHCARTTHRKQMSLGIPPTWETLHASCSGGKVRPKGPSPDFRARAARLGLDPDQRVPFAWLGISPGKSVEVRNMTAALIEQAVALRAAQI